ncbi:MAG: ATP-binding protein [bacterium]
MPSEIQPPSTDIKLEGSLNGFSMDQFVKAVGPILASVPLDLNAPIIIDMSKTSFIEPGGLGMLWMIFRKLCERYPTVSIKLPEDIAIQYYLERIGFFSFAKEYGACLENCQIEEFPEHCESSHLLEMTFIRNDCDVNAVTLKVINQVSIILKETLNYSDGDITSFTTTISEACLNICEHSGSDGIVIAQRYHSAKGAFVRIGVADAGCGIRASLAQNRPEVNQWSHEKAIDYALEKECSRLPNRGLGLYRIRQIVSDYGGSMHLRSGNVRAYVMGIDKKIDFFEEDYELAGTQIAIRLANRLV